MQQPKRTPLSALAGFAEPKGMASPDPVEVPPPPPSPPQPPRDEPAEPPPAPRPRVVHHLPERRSRSGKVGRVQLGIRVDTDTHQILRRVSFERDVGIQTIIDELLEEWVAKQAQPRRRGAEG